MSLGLVAYDCSDDSENESDSDEDAKKNNNETSPSATYLNPLKTTLGGTSVQVPEQDTNVEEITSQEDATSAKLLIPEPKVNLLNTDFDIKSLTGDYKKSGPVKITIPSLNEIEDEADQPIKKKLKPSTKGSGLFALLPEPKGSLIPQSVTSKIHNVPNKKQATPKVPVTKPIVPKAPAKTCLTNYEDSGDEDEPAGIDFFSLDSKDSAPVEVIDVFATDPSPPKTNDDALQFSKNFQPTTWLTASTSPHLHQTSQAPISGHASPLPSDHKTQHMSAYPTNEFMNVSTTDLKLDQEAMQQLCGRRDRLKMQQVSLIDVNGDTLIPDTREWLTKQLTEEQSHRPSHKRKDGPTSQQKRKHQITYLAYQAKENELELQNQWSNNRMSRKQTQAKYGF